MANIDVTYLPYEITGPDTVDNTFSISAALINAETSGGTPSGKKIQIEVTVGTVQFRTDAIVGANSPSIAAANGKISMAVSKGQQIHYKCVAGTDKFNIFY